MLIGIGLTPPPLTLPPPSPIEHIHNECIGLAVDGWLGGRTKTGSVYKITMARRTQTDTIKQIQENPFSWETDFFSDPTIKILPNPPTHIISIIFMFVNGKNTDKNAAPFGKLKVICKKYAVN